jgi:hypothetical protein
VRLVLFFVLIVLGGYRAARALCGLGPDSRTGGASFELASATALLALALGLALSWALALPCLLTGATLLGGALVVAVATTWLGKRGGSRGERARAKTPAAIRIATALGWAALGGWIVFALWRGATVFSPNHDGVSYHLPKAALIAVAHGYETFDGPDARVSFWPCNYELLLADAILLDRSDVHTAWVSTASLVAFLLSVGALAERWWGRGPHTLLAILLAGGITVVLLLSDAHKNDLMAAALFVTAISLTARWAATGEAGPAFMALVSAAIMFGTKVSAPFLIGALAPVVGWGALCQWRLGRRVSPARLALLAVGSLALVILLGGVVFVRNWTDAGRLLPEDPGVPATYDGFANLWRFPLLAFARPLIPSADAIWIPWQQCYRHWGRHDLFFSEWGLPSSLLLCALPFGVARYRRRLRAEGSDGAEGSEGASPKERALASASFVLAFLLFLPIQVPKIGVLATSALCRYTIFIPVLIALWTAVPAVAELCARGRPCRIMASSVLFGAGILFLGYAQNEAKKDVYEPLDYVLSIAEHPEDRRARRSGQNFRAGVIVDRIAAPTDEIAFDGGFDGWSYYAFGATLERKVTYLHPQRERGLVTIPDSVKWVVVDRISNVDFGDPTFLATGDWSLLGHGKSTPEDRAVFEQLRARPDFKLVYSYEEKNQAVFQRVQLVGRLPKWARTASL